MQPSLDKQELRQRIAAVRAAKDAKARAGRRRDLSPDELDKVLPPVDCRRTRDRLEGKRQWAS